MSTRWRERSVSLLKAVSPLLPTVLLAAHPVVSQFQHNQSEVGLPVLWKALAVAAVGGAALFVVFSLVTRQPRRSVASST